MRKTSIDNEEMVVLIQIKGPFIKKTIDLPGTNYVETMDPGKHGEKPMYLTKRVATDHMVTRPGKYRLIDIEVAKHFLSLPDPDKISTPELMEELANRFADKGEFMHDLYPLVLDNNGNAFPISHILNDEDLAKECALRGHRMIGLKAYEHLCAKAENGELKDRVLALEKKLMPVDEIKGTEVSREIPAERLEDAKVVHDANKKEAVEAKDERDSLKDPEPVPYTNFGKMKYDDMRPYATANGVNYNAKKGVMMEALVKIQSKGNLKLPAKRD